MRERVRIMKKKIIVLGSAITVLAAIIAAKRKKQVNHTFYLAKDAPYYNAVKGVRQGILPAVVGNVHQQVVVSHFVNEKWVCLTGDRYMKLSYLQVNIAGVTELMAKEDVIVFDEPHQTSKKVRTLPFGTRVAVVEEAGEWTKIRLHKKLQTVEGYVMTAYMKY